MTERMTLIERLLNPQWVHTQGLGAVLDKDQTIADMKEAAAALDAARVASVIKSNCFIFIKSVEGKTLPTENIEVVEVRGIEEAAKAISCDDG